MYVALAVGNTRSRVAVIKDQTAHDALSLDHADAAKAAAEVASMAEKAGTRDIVVSSVNRTVSAGLTRLLTDQHGLEVHSFGPDLAIPIVHALDDASTVGQDRLLCALGAYTKAKQACVIVDAGTAITVDFVDGEGVFQGGVIAPGLTMMLASLHEKTSALPAVTLAAPDPARGPFGKDTAHAMLLGARNAALGLVRHTIERFAEAYEAYPQIVATGGDAAMLFDGDDLVEHVVPDLQLLGIAEACRILMTQQDEDPEEL